MTTAGVKGTKGTAGSASTEGEAGDKGDVGVSIITGETSETTGRLGVDTSEGDATAATIEGLDTEDATGKEELTLEMPAGIFVIKGLTTGVETTDDVPEGILETAVVEGVVMVVDVEPEITGVDVIPPAVTAGIVGTFTTEEI